MQKIYAEFCRLRDLRDAGAEAPKYTEAQAFEIASAPATSAGSSAHRVGNGKQLPEGPLVAGNTQAALSDAIPPLPELDTPANMEHLFSTPADWDEDYRNTWKRLQVAERNKMQWRIYALKLRTTMAATAAELEEWRFTNKVDELQRENGRLRLVASRAESAPVVATGEPFMYAIKGPDGAAYLDEYCVDNKREGLFAELNGLNDSPDTGYTIVPVYLAAPQQHSQAALSDEVIDHMWKMYQQGQESADHTAKEVFAQTLQALADWLPNQQPAAAPNAPTKVETVTLDGHQLRHALDLINPDGPENRDQLDDYLIFGIVQHKADDETVSTGMCCWNDDMGGEVMPLDGEWTAPPTPPQEAAALDDLLPCPFCGNEPISQEIEAHSHSGPLKALGIPDHSGSYTIECPTSGCCGMIADTKAEATAAWNRRGAMAAQHALTFQPLAQYRANLAKFIAKRKA